MMIISGGSRRGAGRACSVVDVDMGRPEILVNWDFRPSRDLFEG
jgi:hypothetical protein